MTVLSPDAIRAQFPALSRRHGGHPVAYFDGPGGTQVPRGVVEAMSDYLYHHNANTHWAYPTSEETDRLVLEAREVLAAFLNGSAREIVFGQTMTTLTFHLARGLGMAWRPGSIRASPCAKILLFSALLFAGLAGSQVLPGLLRAQSACHPGPLRDRMKIIYLSGYTTEEKLGIAKKYLLPKQLEEHGLTTTILSITDQALNLLIAQYTREAGVRNLEREIANLCRKVAKRIAEGKEKKYMVTAKNLQGFLGVPKFLPEEEMAKDEIGVSTGLAWTEAGGDIIYIEATTMKARGNLTLTGQLGDVMKEFAQAALSYVRSTAKTLGIKDDIFSKTDVHIHVPAGAIPKDGPSAGITIATAIASVFNGRPVNKNIAMTGEVTLRGRVPPIGGLKEKTLAAKRMGIRKIILPKRNKKDLEDIPKYIKKDMECVFAETMDQVMKAALKAKKKA